MHRPVFFIHITLFVVSDIQSDHILHTFNIHCNTLHNNDVHGTACPKPQNMFSNKQYGKKTALCDIMLRVPVNTMTKP